MREIIVSLLSGQKMGTAPVFSGLIHVSTEGLQHEGLTFHEVHHDARKMARAAASTFKWSGMRSATLPLDLCAPAEVLGAELNFYEDGRLQFPQVKRAVFQSTKDMGQGVSGHERKGRIPLICEAIQFAKEEIGREAVIAGMLPGPYTLLLYLCHLPTMIREMRKEPQAVLDALFHLASLLAEIGKAYRAAGADFLTVHDMGGSAGFVGPSVYEQFVFPAEKDLIEKLPKPRVLSVCGRMDQALPLLAQSGAEAVSVDEMTNLKAARETLQGTLLFGNIDPLNILWRGEEMQVIEAVAVAREAGVDAVWPGCDLVPSTPLRNIRRMLE